MDPFQVPANIQVIDKPEDYEKMIGIQIVEKQPEQNIPRPQMRPSIKTTERVVEGYKIPDNIPVYDKAEDAYEIPSNVSVKENSQKEEIPQSTISEEELDIWNKIKEELDNTQGSDSKQHEFLMDDPYSSLNNIPNKKINTEKLLEWLKERLSGVSFCQTYLTDKVDGDNGIVKENATLCLETERGSKFFLNKAGKYHRLDGPAIEWVYGAKEYFKNGIRHRIGGPAYENKDDKQFWFEGKQYSEPEYWIVSQEIENLK